MTLWESGKFTKDYFTFWVFLAIAWGFGAAIIITFLPLMESTEELGSVFKGMLGMKSEPAARKKVSKVDEALDEA
jgi:hypothetical protein